MQIAELAEAGAVMLDNLVKPEVQLVLVVLGGYEDNGPRLWHRTNPVFGEHGSDSELLHDQAFADAAFAGQQRDVAAGNAIVHKPSAFGDRLAVPHDDIDAGKPRDRRLADLARRPYRNVACQSVQPIWRAAGIEPVGDIALQWHRWP